MKLDLIYWAQASPVRAASRRTAADERSVELRGLLIDIAFASRSHHARGRIGRHAGRWTLDAGAVAEPRRVELHLRFVAELYDLQMKEGRYFLHENPAGAKSWERADGRHCCESESGESRQRPVPVRPGVAPGRAGQETNLLDEQRPRDPEEARAEVSWDTRRVLQTERRAPCHSRRPCGT